MKSTPFDPNTNLAPLPFSDEICQSAKSLKNKGLSWQPHVGCFVWDEDGNINVPSPFPNQIYFILNLGHFLKIFETIENMQDKLVWIPSFYQAQQIAQKLNISHELIKNAVRESTSLEQQFKGMYQLIENHL